MSLPTEVDDALLHFADVLESAIMIVGAHDDKVLYANLAVCKLLGTDRLNLEGNTTLALNLWSHPEDKSLLTDLVLHGTKLKKHKVEIRNSQNKRVSVLLSIDSVEISGMPCFQFCFESTSRKDTRKTLLQARRYNQFSTEQGVHRNGLFAVSQKNYEEVSQLLLKLVDQEKHITCKLAQDLHDHLGQTLTAISLLWGNRQQKSGRELDSDIDILIRQAVYELRMCLADLRPPLIEKCGFLAALQNEISRQSALRKCHHISLEVNSGCVEFRWPPDVEYGAFMVAREAISNALNHAQANQIKVSVNASDQRLLVKIMDDGRGFETQSRTVCAGHLGLVGMIERAKAINAHLSIVSNVAEGTCIQLSWRKSD